MLWMRCDFPSGITGDGTGLFDLLDVFFFADDHEDFAVLDDKIGRGHHLELAGNDIPDGDDLDVIPAPELELGD